MEPLAVTRSLSLDASPEEVWQLVADQAGLAGWLGGDLQLDVQPGGVGRLVDEGGRVRRLVVEGVDAGRSLRWVWWDEDQPADASTVEVRIESDDEGTRLIVTETALAGGARACSLAEAAIGSAWDSRLNRVEERFGALVGAGRRW